jgi:branched-subunit amino acid transport protein
LSFIPISVMGALVAGEALMSEGAILPPLSNPAIPSAVIAALTFRLSRSFLGATLAGMITYVLLRSVL